MVTRAIQFLTENWGLKLTAVGMAVLLWMAVRANEPDRATFPGVPVDVVLRDADWQLAGPPVPPTVRVTVVGPTGELLSLANELPSIVVPIEQVTDTLVSQVVSVQWVQLPGGTRDARVIDVEPDTVQLRYERLASTALPVYVPTTGEPPEGFTLARPISTNPSLVEVRGPATRLSDIDTVRLLPVDVSGIRSTTNVPTLVDTASLSGLSVTPREVNVILRVVPDSMAEDVEVDGEQSPP